MSSTFERRMVTPHMKVQYQTKGGSFGTKKQQMGLELWWHGYGVAVRAGACTTARPKLRPPPDPEAGGAGTRSQWRDRTRQLSARAASNAR